MVKTDASIYVDNVYSVYIVLYAKQGKQLQSSAKYGLWPEWRLIYKSCSVRQTVVILLVCVFLFTYLYSAIQHLCCNYVNKTQFSSVDVDEILRCETLI